MKKKKSKVDSTKMWFDLLCWFHEVIWMMEDMPPKKQSHPVKWWNKPTHSSHDVHASSQECNFPLFRIIHFLFNRSRLIYLDLASDQVQLCIRWGGGRGRKKRNNQFVVKLHIIKVRFTLNTIEGIFLIFSYFNAIRFNRKEKIITE